MERQIRIRNRIINQMEAILGFAKKIDDTTTENSIRPRVADLIKHYEDFNDVEVALHEYSDYISVTPKIASQYYEARALLEDALVKITGRAMSKGGDDLNETLENFVTQQKTFYESINMASAVKLPKISIEPFSGDYKMWPSFRDLYVNAIHDHPKLKNAQKLQQLKSLLRGEAAGLIRHITTTDQNYDEAWQKLSDRYEKPKPIVSSLIQSFLDQKACKNTNHRDLRRLYDQSDEIVRALRSLGTNEESRDPWVIHILLQKVDIETKQLWARDSVDNAHPAFNDFLKFLNIRCDTLESCNIQERRIYPTQATKSFIVEQTSKDQVPTKGCYACNEDHLIYRCPSFRNSKVADRIALVNKNRLCHNYLRKGHLTNQCFSRTSCLICRRKHHSLLHTQQTTANSIFIEPNPIMHTTNSNTKPVTNSNIHPTSYLQSTNDHHSTTTLQSTMKPQSTSHLQHTSKQQLSQGQSQPSMSCPAPNNTITQSETEAAHSYLVSRNNHEEAQSFTSVMLPTAKINVKSRSGEYVQARALLDSGSQCDFVTEALIRRLGLTRTKSDIRVVGLASSHVGTTKGSATIVIQSRVDPTYSITLTSQIIKYISSKLPESTFCVDGYEKLKEIELADPTFNEARPVDMLIGAEHFFDIVQSKRMSIPVLPMMCQSHFGWLVAGNLESTIQVNRRTTLMVKSMEVQQDDINELFKRFWEIEEPPVMNHANLDQDQCEIMYKSTTMLTDDNRFTVRLPFATPRPTLGNSYVNAKCRLLAMERKFAKNPEFKNQYIEFMREYIQLSHMKKVDWSQLPADDDKRYFLPHHGVYKESSSTTKLRVVFDASCKTSTSVSLNDILHVGPKIQRDLFSILLRFRVQFALRVKWHPSNKELFTEVPIEVHAWSDSTIVLQWLPDIPRRWKTFIANRTSYILDIIPTKQWHYIPGKQNPADLLTRGIHPDRLYQTKLWWEGPTWLIQESSKWPHHQLKTNKHSSTITEARSNALLCRSLTSQHSLIDQLITTCSSFMKLKYSMVYILRFGGISTGKKCKVYGPPQIEELNYAERMIVRTIQLEAFRDELTRLRHNMKLQSNSKLKTLNIFVDAAGVLRVGGRLKNAHLNYNSQHPIILSRRHPLNYLIIKEIHHGTLHGGVSIVLNTLRLKFWMCDARNTIKHYIKKCVTCIRHRIISANQKMADLPIERVTQNRPFQNVGLDYAGPILIKSSKLRKAPVVKAYIAVFVCLTVKAVHLEVVSSLDAESFISALRRFIARRGLPCLICCDNGSNFVAANAELKLLSKQLAYQQKSNEVLNFCLQKNIQFRFNPPSGPHFGGLWEATVKSMKFHLRRVTSNVNFTFEELTTMITQIEAILNSRPLSRLYDDPDELEALTPGHFLIGEPLLATPEPNLDGIPVNKLNVWQNIQKRIQGFWKSWHHDYLTTLTQRSKWQTDGPVFKTGDVVLIRETNLPPMKWMMGRILAIYPGTDGITRVVKIKTKHGEFIRPVVKLIKLPVTDEKDG